MTQKVYDHPAICGAYFFPLPSGPLPEAEGARVITLEAPDRPAVGGYFSSPLASAPTLLYFHGNGECIGDQLGHWPTWARHAGLNIFFVDYPGYATSLGSPSLSSCREAAWRAFAFLMEQPKERVPSLLIGGRSVGSIFALDVASRASADARTAGRFRGLMLESGVADLQQRLDLRFASYAAAGVDEALLRAQVAEDFDHRKKVRSLDGPLLVLHTSGDSLVPAWHGEKLAEWAEEAGGLHRLVLFDDGDHNSIQMINAAAYQRELAGFVEAIAS